MNESIIIHEDIKAYFSSHAIVRPGSPDPGPPFLPCATTSRTARRHERTPGNLEESLEDFPESLVDFQESLEDFPESLQDFPEFLMDNYDLL